MKPIDFFRFCPRCAQPREDPRETSTFRCSSCALVYFFNPATAAAAFIVNSQGEALFIRRAKDPAKGKLAIPGGFVDFGETAEEAVRREIREEVNVEVDALEYLCSQPNQYHYQEVTYSVLDLFFVGTARPHAAVSALDDVASYCWLRPAEIEPADLAFPSIRQALGLYVATRP